MFIAKKLINVWFVGFKQVCLCLIRTFILTTQVCAQISEIYFQNIQNKQKILFRVRLVFTVHEIFYRNCPYLYVDHRNNLPLFLVSCLPLIKSYVWTFNTEGWCTALCFTLKPFHRCTCSTLYELVALQFWFFLGSSFSWLFLICFLQDSKFISVDFLGWFFVVVVGFFVFVLWGFFCLGFFGFVGWLVDFV